MPPKGNNRDRGSGIGNEMPNIAQLVNEQLLASLPHIVTQIADSMSTARETAGESEMTGCNYESFMSYKPKEFYGTEGVIGLIKWIENMETVLYLSNCTEEERVKFTSCQLQGGALIWWKHQIHIKGREAAYQLSWEEFTNLLIEEYCSKDERQKLEEEFWNHSMVGTEIEDYTFRFHELTRFVPHMVTPERRRIDRYIYGLVPTIRGRVTSANPTTIQSAVVLANRLTDDLIRSGKLTKDKPSNKRKADTQQNKDTGGNNNNRNKKVKNFGMTAPTGEQTDTGRYGGSKPKCSKCQLHHVGECPVCSNCKQTGHLTKYCKKPEEVKKCCYECGSTEHFRSQCPKIKGPNQRVCYECGNPNHMRYNCPRLKRMGGGTGNQEGNARGRAFVIGAEEAMQNEM